MITDNSSREATTNELGEGGGRRIRATKFQWAIRKLVPGTAKESTRQHLTRLIIIQLMSAWAQDLQLLMAGLDRA
jgi:hypothetical protein